LITMKKIKKEDDLPEPMDKKLMNEMEISRYLQQAYINKVPVIIQANTLNNGNYYPDLHCLVLGSQENKIFLLLKDNRTISCEINQIRNIEFMSIENWYNK